MAQDLVCYYRISDAFQAGPAGNAAHKARPTWFDKRACLLNFMRVFGAENLFLIADCVGDATRAWLESLVPAGRVSYTSYRSGAFSFLHAARMAAQQAPDTKVYLVEDDYVHTQDAPACLAAALDVADYATGYDHPDKYCDAGTVSGTGCVGNPLISDRSEATRVYVTPACHVKLTNSTTCTFATTAGTVRTDYQLYEAFCQSGYPHDYALFRTLIERVGRKLVSTLPAKATHCESAYLAPLVDWAACTSLTP